MLHKVVKYRACVSRSLGCKAIIQANNPIVTLQSREAQLSRRNPHDYSAMFFRNWKCNYVDGIHSIFADARGVSKAFRVDSDSQALKIAERIR